MYPDSKELMTGRRPIACDGGAPNSMQVATPRKRETVHSPGTKAQLALEAPLVSVVIPCYNQAHFLGEAIQSVLRQTYRPVEVVVVDDGSVDHTRDVAASFPEVRYIKQENRGLAAARNTGIRESKGNHLIFLDADDRLLPTALEAGMNGFRAHPECAFVFGTYRCIASDGSPFNETESARYVDNDHYRALLHGNYIGMHATVMYRRSALESAKGFDSMVDACADYDLYMRIARNLPVYYHAEMVAEYRIHGTNMSRNPRVDVKDSIGSAACTEKVCRGR